MKDVNVRVIQLLFICLYSLLLLQCDSYYRLRGDAFRHAKNHEKALTYYERIPTNKWNVDIMRNMAVSYKHTADTNAVHDLYTRIFNITGKEEDGDALLSVLFHASRTNEIVNVLHTLINTGQDPWYYRKVLLEMYYLHQRTQDVIHTLHSVASTVEGEEDSEIKLALLAKYYDMTTNSITYVKNALQNNPDDAELQKALASEYVFHEMYDEALTQLYRCIEHTPDDAELFHMLGNVYASKDDYTEAEEWLRKALSMDSGNAYIMNNLAYVLLMLDTPPEKEALELARSAVQCVPTIEALDTLGLALYYNESYNSALLYLEKAHEKIAQQDREEPIVDMHTAFVYLACGKTNRAKEYAERAIRESAGITNEFSKEYTFLYTDIIDIYPRSMTNDTYKN